MRTLLTSDPRRRGTPRRSLPCPNSADRNLGWDAATLASATAAPRSRDGVGDVVQLAVQAVAGPAQEGVRLFRGECVRVHEDADRRRVEGVLVEGSGVGAE